MVLDDNDNDNDDTSDDMRAHKSGQTEPSTSRRKNKDKGRAAKPKGTTSSGRLPRTKGKEKQTEAQPEAEPGAARPTTSETTPADAVNAPSAPAVSSKSKRNKKAVHEDPPELDLNDFVADVMGGDYWNMLPAETTGE